MKHQGLMAAQLFAMASAAAHTNPEILQVPPTPMPKPKLTPIQKSIGRQAWAIAGRHHPTEADYEKAREITLHNAKMDQAQRAKQESKKRKKLGLQP